MPEQLDISSWDHNEWCAITFTQRQGELDMFTFLLIFLTYSKKCYDYYFYIDLSLYSNILSIV